MRSLVFVAGLSVIALGAAGRAADEVQLFNGKNIDGWIAVFAKAGPKVESVWFAKEGELVCKGRSGAGGYLRTDKEYANFTLSFEWRFEPGKPGNSGVLVAVTGADKVWPTSYEVQLKHENAGDIFTNDTKLVGPAERTEDRRLKKLHASNEKPLGEWNAGEITLRDGRLTVKINGQLQNEADQVAKGPGKIALQSEGVEIHFRNLKLQPLAEDKRP